MDIVRIFDTTLRDGEQSPGFSMTVPEKVRMARQFESLGVDIIESGFPISSRGDLEGVRAVTREIRNCTVAALARARRDDIDVALDGLSGAAHPRLHTFPGDFGFASALQTAHDARRGARSHLDQRALRARALRGS